MKKLLLNALCITFILCVFCSCPHRGKPLAVDLKINDGMVIGVDITDGQNPSVKDIVVTLDENSKFKQIPANTDASEWIVGIDGISAKVKNAVNENDTSLTLELSNTSVTSASTITQDFDVKIPSKYIVGEKNGSGKAKIFFVQLVPTASISGETFYLNTWEEVNETKDYTITLAGTCIAKDVSREEFSTLISGNVYFKNELLPAYLQVVLKSDKISAGSTEFAVTFKGVPAESGGFKRVNQLNAFGNILIKIPESILVKSASSGNPLETAANKNVQLNISDSRSLSFDNTPIYIPHPNSNPNYIEVTVSLHGDSFKAKAVGSRVDWFDGIPYGENDMYTAGIMAVTTQAIPEGATEAVIKLSISDEYGEYTGDYYLAPTDVWYWVNAGDLSSNFKINQNNVRIGIGN